MTLAALLCAAFGPDDSDPSGRPTPRGTPVRSIEGRTQAEALAQIRGGNLEAFEAVYRTYFPRLFKFAYGFVRSHAAAEEVLHDLFLHLWERRATLEVHEDLGVYLYAAVRNRAYKQSRHAGIVRRLEHAVEQHLADIPAFGLIANPESAFDSAEILRAFTAALAAISERDRQIVRMRWEDGMSFDDIARVLGISKTRVRALVIRIQDKIRPFFEHVYDGGNVPKKEPDTGE